MAKTPQAPSPGPVRGLVLRIGCSFCRGPPLRCPLLDGQSCQTARVPCPGSLLSHSKVWGGFSSKQDGLSASRHPCAMTCGIHPAP